MKCMSKELTGILPGGLRGYFNEEIFSGLQEIRMRIGQPVLLVTDKLTRKLDYKVGKEDISFVIHGASRYSPWNATTMAKGYLTAPGGHRIGVCGDVISDKGIVRGIRTPNALCIRIAKEFRGIGNGVDLRDNLLLIGPPGSGKTTLLRDLICRISEENRGFICVVDERGEIFPQWDGKSCFSCGEYTDILTGCPKPEGIEMVLRTMGPEWIAVDEITAREDCDALIQAGWCGVKLVATAHAANVEDLMSRQVYRPLVETKLFRSVLVLNRNKTIRMERMIL